MPSSDPITPIVERRDDKKEEKSNLDDERARGNDKFRRNYSLHLAEQRGRSRSASPREANLALSKSQPPRSYT
ncbi:unnamed protein product [Musa hybrid cultivar]